MEAKFSQRVKDVIAFSREEAMRLGNDYIGIEHLMLGIIRDGEGIAIQILSFLDVNLVDLKKNIEKAISKESSHSKKEVDNIPLIKQAEKALKITYLEAKTFKSELIGTEHLLLAILKDEENIATKLLNKSKVTYDIVKAELSNLQDSDDQENKYDVKNELPEDMSDDQEDEGKSFANIPKKAGDSKSKTPVLDNFGR